MKDFLLCTAILPLKIFTNSSIVNVVVCRYHSKIERRDIHFIFYTDTLKSDTENHFKILQGSVKGPVIDQK